MNATTITAGPFANKDGKWCLIARRGCLVIHLTTTRLNSIEELTDAVVADLAAQYAVEAGVSPEEALAAVRAR